MRFWGLGHLESRAKGEARLALEGAAGWASPSSRGLWGGATLCCSPPALETLDPHHRGVTRAGCSWGTPVAAATPYYPVGLSMLGSAQIHMRQSASRSRSLRANAAKIKDKARSLLARKFSKKAAGDDALQARPALHPLEHSAEMSVNFRRALACYVLVCMHPIWTTYAAN
jgi:hypothetical protein